jgi:hypothetical protein
MMPAPTPSVTAEAWVMTDSSWSVPNPRYSFWPIVMPERSATVMVAGAAPATIDTVIVVSTVEKVFVVEPSA